ncbi:hypothetical protein JHK85_050364 [Glycine max]|nr:hypothetical protein JHK85_050364 [Glycine max]
MLTVIDNRWISTQLLFCLMDDAFELSRLQMSWKWRTRMRLMPCFTIPEKTTHHSPANKLHRRVERRHPPTFPTRNLSAIDGAKIVARFAAVGGGKGHHVVQ